jgi:hypothetical protein
MMEAMRLFTQASARDPDYAVAYAMTMYCHVMRVAYQKPEFPEKYAEALRLAGIPE